MRFSRQGAANAPGARGKAILTLSLVVSLLAPLGCGASPAEPVLPTGAASVLTPAATLVIAADIRPASLAEAAAASLAEAVALPDAAAAPLPDATAAPLPDTAAAPVVARERWSPERARQWHEARGWLVGVNYIPSSAVNQLEMWQADTFDPTTIERELGWAESLGFTSLRVFLHDLAWKEDPSGFKERIDQFLSIAHEHRLGALLVIFDGVWNPVPKAGKQPLPRPHVHNSGWVQSPGAQILGDPARQDELEPYVKDIVGHFKDDPRVDGWDVFNEPDNDNAGSYGDLELRDKAALSALLIEKTFRWAREVGASQPLTAAPWVTDFSRPEKLRVSDRAMLDGSDIISFHHYGSLKAMRRRIENLRRYGRPIICTEYMARPLGSTFNPILGYLNAQGGGAYSWGFVNGKSQTIYPWSSWKHASSAAPKPWFHDLLDANGKAYDPKEVAYIRALTGKTPRPLELQAQRSEPPPPLAAGKAAATASTKE